MPVWHVSISLGALAGRLRNEPYLAEQEAIRLLRGVGGDREWWYWSPKRIGHLRVAVTAEENELIPPACVIADAGEAGPERRRSG